MTGTFSLSRTSPDSCEDMNAILSFGDTLSTNVGSSHSYCRPELFLKFGGGHVKVGLSVSAKYKGRTLFKDGHNRGDRACPPLGRVFLKFGGGHVKVGLSVSAKYKGGTLFKDGHNRGDRGLSTLGESFSQVWWRTCQSWAFCVCKIKEEHFSKMGTIGETRACPPLGRVFLKCGRGHVKV